jgi:membrane protein DedA with SNARE-associated domain
MVAFIRTNPGWAVFVSGLTAFGESFVFLSLLFPGTAILIASGALISEGVLDPLLPTVAGIGGAVFGDRRSFADLARLSSPRSLDLPLVLFRTSLLSVRKTTMAHTLREKPACDGTRMLVDLNAAHHEVSDQEVDRNRVVLDLYELA